MKSIFSEVLNGVGNEVSSITQQLNRLTTLGVSLLLLGFGNSYSQCPSINFNLINFDICCYAVEVDNQSECTPELRMLLDNGQFTNLTVDVFNGFSATLISPTEILVSHSSGIIPFGMNTPIQFCAEGASNPIISMLYDFNCGPGISCSEDIPLIGCSSQDSCIANFEYLIETNCGLFQFLGSSTGLPPVTYSWNFGDPGSGGANTSNLQNPTHQFSKLCENYIVCLDIMAEDGCTESICQEIFVLELESPTITCPIDILVHCESDISPSFTGFATAVDNCEANPDISFEDEDVGSFPCDYEVIRTWSVVDQCGHLGTCEQIITVFDNTPPVITCPDDVIVSITNADSCTAVVNNLQLVSINDNCSSTLVTYAVTGATIAQGNQNASGLTFYAGVSTVTYTVADECGNVSTCSFSVTVTCDSSCPGNLIQNAGFSMGTIAGPMPIGKADNWSKGYGTPVVSNEEGCDNSGYITLKGNKNFGDAIFQHLSTPIKKGHVYQLSACVVVDDGCGACLPYVKIRAMAFNNSLPSTGNHPLPNSDISNIDVSGRIGRSTDTPPDWTTYVFHRYKAPKDYDNIALAVENSELISLGLNSSVHIDNICLYEVNDSIPCYLAEFDSMDSLISSLGEIDPDFPVLEDDVDMFNGSVNDIYAYCNPAPNNLDTWYEFCLDSCESIGGELPDELVDFIQNDSLGNYFMDSLGVDIATFDSDLDGFLDSLELLNSGQSPLDSLMGLGALSFDCRALPPQGPAPNDPNSPFNGRDIVFVHGLRMDPILEKLQLQNAGCQTEWPADRNEFYSGYWKSGAYNYWNDHTEQYLKTKVSPSTFVVTRTGSYSNRYIVVTHPATQNFVYGVSSVLEQIANAMTAGVGVINCNPGETRPTNTFGHNGFIIISHSDGAPLTDVVLTIADLTRYPPLSTMLGDVSFIADRCDVHVAVQGAFGGSNYASLLLMANTTGLQYVKPLVEEFLGGPIQGSTSWLFRSELLDMSITKPLWSFFINRVPVCVLTIAGGHPTDYGEQIGPGNHKRILSLLSKHVVHRGFDDGVLGIESQSSNPDLRLLNPNVYLPKPGILGSQSPLNEKIYDMGIPKDRGMRYYMDQKLDILTSVKHQYASAACIPWLSPTGMVQPVLVPGFPLVPGFDALKRHPNHYSFLQSASDHYQGAIEFPNYPDYEKTYDDASRNWEESRVVTSNDVYSKCGVNPLKLNQVEYIRGKSKTFRLWPSKKTVKVWIWKRKYHVLQDYDQKNQLDYLYDSLYK